jgi:LacI family transcriptional regulator
VLAKSTIYEVAQRSGVSTATVSRVMRNGAGFSEPTRRRVLRVASELGWLPNGSARSLAERRVGIIGLLFPDLGKEAEAESESPLFVDQVIRGAERAATLVGDAVLIASTEGAGGRERARSIAGKVDGLVVTARSLSKADLTSIARSIPVVLIASQTPQRTLDVVCADNLGGARRITEHLLDIHGSRELAFVAGPSQSPDSIQRFAGFRAALTGWAERTGDTLELPTTPHAHGGFTEAGGARAMTQILDGRPRPPRAVVFGNDEMAIGALAVLRARKLRVPADVAITGFDDIASARHVRPALTTVRQPMRQLGEEAVRILLERLGKPEAGRQLLTLPTELEIRRSCGCASTNTPSRSSR